MFNIMNWVEIYGHKTPEIKKKKKREEKEKSDQWLSRVIVVCGGQISPLSPLSPLSPVRERGSDFGIGLSPRLNQMKVRRWLARVWRDVTAVAPAQRRAFMRRNKRRSLSFALVALRTDLSVFVLTEKPQDGQERLVHVPQGTDGAVRGPLFQDFAWK